MVSKIRKDDKSGLGHKFNTCPHKKRIDVFQDIECMFQGEIVWINKVGPSEDSRAAKSELINWWNQCNQ